MLRIVNERLTVVVDNVREISKILELADASDKRWGEIKWKFTEDRKKTISIERSSEFLLLVEIDPIEPVPTAGYLAVTGKIVSSPF